MVKNQLVLEVEVGCVQQAVKQQPENHSPVLRISVKRRLTSQCPLLRAAPQCQALGLLSAQAVGTLWASSTGALSGKTPDNAGWSVPKI